MKPISKSASSFSTQPNFKVASACTQILSTRLMRLSLLTLLALSACTTPQVMRRSAPPAASRTPPVAAPDALRSAYSLRLLGEQRLPTRIAFEKVPAGGFSALDFDPASNTLYVLSDDRSELGAARFYTGQIKLSNAHFENLILTDMVKLRKPDGGQFTRPPSYSTAVPKAIRFDPLTKSLLWASEGERRPPRIVQSFIRKSRLDGRYDDQLALPEMFTLRSDSLGPRNGLGLEAMSLSPKGETIWFCNEDSLYQDGEPSTLTQGGVVRLTRIDRAQRAAQAQFAYVLDAIPKPPEPANDYADNGVAEILAIDEQRLIVLERSFATGKGYSVRLYEVSLEGATNVLKMPSLKAGAYQPVRKRLIADLDSFGLPRLDNLEGLSWGPRLPNGKRSVLMVSNDHFSPEQITQFLAFEWNGD